MKKNLFTVVSLVLLLAVGFVSFSTVVEAKNVALVLSGGLGDRSYLDSTYRGLTWAKEELGVNTRHVEPAGAEEYETSIRVMAMNGYDLIITVGFGMLDATETVAAQFPNVQFAIVDADSDMPNVSGLIFEEHVGSYLVGVLAAEMTETDTVGFVGGQEIPLISKFEEGFTEGVKAVNPDARVLIGYAGVFDDPGKGKEVAISQYNRGADVVYHAAGKTGEGVIEAAKEVDKYVIGVDSDQCYIAPDNMISSMMKRVDVAVFRVIEDFVNDAFKPGTKIYGLEEEAVGPCRLFPQEFEHNDFPGIDEAMEVVEEYGQKLLDGEIVVVDPTGMVD